MILRALVLLLLCMNLGVAAWWATHREPPAAAIAPTEKGVASLTMLSEAERRPAADAAELSVDPEPLSTGSACLSIGPFATPADLRRAVNALLPKVERIQFREVAAVAVRGYRVFLPAAANRAEALAIARALSASGIADYYVVTAGDQQNTVSLGIFRELENATQRRDQVAALGYNPSVETRTEPVPQWWIDLAALAGFDWRALVPDQGLQANSAPCT